MYVCQEKSLSVLDMVKSKWVYKQLKNFRAGIEANISRLSVRLAFPLRLDGLGWIQAVCLECTCIYNLLCWPGLSWLSPKRQAVT